MHLATILACQCVPSPRPVSLPCYRSQPQQPGRHTAHGLPTTQIPLTYSTAPPHLCHPPSPMPSPPTAACTHTRASVPPSPGPCFTSNGNGNGNGKGPFTPNEWHVMPTHWLAVTPPPSPAVTPPLLCSTIARTRRSRGSGCAPPAPSRWVAGGRWPARWSRRLYLLPRAAPVLRCAHYCRRRTCACVPCAPCLCLPHACMYNL